MTLHNAELLALHFKFDFLLLQKFEKKYQRELGETKKVSPQTQFEYAWCLVRSDFPSDIKKVNACSGAVGAFGIEISMKKIIAK